MLEEKNPIHDWQLCFGMVKSEQLKPNYEALDHNLGQVIISATSDTGD